MANPEPSSRVNLNKFYAIILIVCTCKKGDSNSVIKSPLSGSANTFEVLLFCTRWLEQRQVAMPPADTPVMTIESPLQKLNCLSRQLNVSMTLLQPLKQSFLSLQEMGSVLVPEYSLPSQQMTQILVQSQNTGLSVCLVESSPQESKLRVGVAFLVEPKLPFDRWQQLSSVSATVKPQQKPPLLKYIMYLFLFPAEPRWQQMPCGVPSRQDAPLYWECRTRVQRFIWRWTRVKDRNMIEKCSKDPIFNKIIKHCNVIIVQDELRQISNYIMIPYPQLQLSSSVQSINQLLFHLKTI